MCNHREGPGQILSGPPERAKGNHSFIVSAVRKRADRARSVPETTSEVQPAVGFASMAPLAEEIAAMELQRVV